MYIIIPELTRLLYNINFIESIDDLKKLKKSKKICLTDFFYYVIIE
jgi:hypothetical protein